MQNMYHDNIEDTLQKYRPNTFFRLDTVSDLESETCITVANVLLNDTPFKNIEHLLVLFQNTINLQSTTTLIDEIAVLNIDVEYLRLFVQITELFHESYNYKINNKENWIHPSLNVNIKTLSEILVFHLSAREGTFSEIGHFDIKTLPRITKDEDIVYLAYGAIIVMSHELKHIPSVTDLGVKNELFDKDGMQMFLKFSETFNDFNDFLSDKIPWIANKIDFSNIDELSDAFFEELTSDFFGILYSDYFSKKLGLKLFHLVIGLFSYNLSQVLIELTSLYINKTINEKIHHFEMILRRESMLTSYFISHWTNYIEKSNYNKKYNEIMNLFKDLLSIRTYILSKISILFKDDYNFSITIDFMEYNNILEKWGYKSERFSHFAFLHNLELVEIDGKTIIKKKCINK